MSNFNNDILMVVKRKGTSDDPYVSLSETKTITNGMIVLKEVPDDFSGVTLSGASKTWIEVKTNANNLTTGQFYSDFKNGYLYFSSIDNNLSVTINYMGTGGLYVANTRVVSLDSSGNITQTLQDWVNTAQAPVNNFTATIGQYDNAKSYVINNIVNYNGGFYVCIQNTTGNAPTINSNNGYWNYWMGANTQLSTFPNEVIVTSTVSSVQVGISAFNATQDTLIVHKNSTYMQPGIDYTVSGGSIIPVGTGATWVGTTSTPLVFDFLVLKNTVSTILPNDGSLLNANSVGNLQLASDIKIGSLANLSTPAADIVTALNNTLHKNTNGNYTIGSKSFVQEVNGDLWTTVNAYYDGTHWQRVDTTKFAFALQMQGTNNIYGETVQGTNIWRCVPGTNPILGFTQYGGWEACLIFTGNQNMVVGGENLEIDGSGASTQYGRINQIADGTFFSKNAFYDGSAWQRDDIAKPASAIRIGTDGSIKTYYVASGANPITWTINNTLDDGNGNFTAKGKITDGNGNDITTNTIFRLMGI